MDIQVQTALIAGVAGLATGTVGSLFAPWSQWGVEKRRERLKGRTTRVNEWRAGMAEAEGYKTLNHVAFSKRGFLTEPWYSSLRPHLEASVRTQMEYTPEPETIVVIVDRTDHRHPLAVVLSDEVDRIANAWKIP